MADTPVFQGHHVVEQGAYARSDLLRALSQEGLYDLHGPRNILNLPADQALAARLGLSPHPGGPLGAYSARLQEELMELQRSPDGQATLRGDRAAAERMALRVGELTDTLKTGMVNGDLHSNTAQGLTREQANQRINHFFDDIDGYRQTHAAQIAEVGRMPAQEARWAGVTRTEGNVAAALDAVDQPGMKPVAGDPAAGRQSMGTAIAEANTAGRLPLSEPMQTRLRTAFPQEMPVEFVRPPVAAGPRGPTPPEVRGTTPPEVRGPTVPEPRGPTPPEVRGTTTPPEVRGPAAPDVRIPAPGSAAPEGAVRPGSGTAMRVAGGVGVALMAYDFVTTGHRVVSLRAEGNEAAAASAQTHFVGRNVGGVLGGVGAGFVYGAIAGSETGPGALVTGIIGAGVGAYLGERWAAQKDVERVFTQTDRNDNEWTRDPADPQGRWTRATRTENSQGGGSSEIRLSAAGRLVDELNYRAANDSYSLGLGSPPRPQDPFRFDASAATQPPRAPFEIGRDYVRDAQTGHWQLETREMVDGRIPITRHAPVSAERATELERQSALTIAQNAANTPAATAARYQIAYNQFGWGDFASAEPVPAVIRNAAAQTGTLQASDGNTYTRGDNGEWNTPGMIYGTNQATGNIREELNRTYRSQHDGLRELAGYAAEALAHPTPTQFGMREAVANAYARAGVARGDAEIDAATRAVQRDHERDGLGQSPYTLRAKSDGTVETLVGHDDRRMEVRSVTTPAEIQQARSQPADVPPAVAPTPPPTTAPAPPTPGGPAPDRASLDDAANPRHGMFRQAFEPVRARDAEMGRASDTGSIQLAAGMTADARARGLETIAFAQFSPDGRRFLMADTPDPSLPWARTAVGDVAQGVQQSVADSTQRVAQIDRAQAETQQLASPTQQQTRDAAVVQGPRLA